MTVYELASKYLISQIFLTSWPQWDTAGWLVDLSNLLSSALTYVLLASSAAAATAKLLQPCPTLCDPIEGSPPGSPRPWDSPGKNTGVSCHFLLQCMTVKSEREVIQSCPTLCNPMDCSLPRSSVHGVFQARVLEWGAITFSDIWHEVPTN